LKKALTGVHRNCEVLALDLEWDGDRVKRAVLNDLAMAPVDGTFPTIERVVPDANAIGGRNGVVQPALPCRHWQGRKDPNGQRERIPPWPQRHKPRRLSVLTRRRAMRFAVVMPYRCNVAPIVSGDVADILGRDAPAASEKAA
jgi:hypothetical protein